MVDAPSEGAYDSFELVLLKRPVLRAEISDEEAERLQQLHLDHLRSMHEAGHLAVAGPFDEQDDETLRGVCLYHVGSVERARALAESDPSVVAGRLAVEAMRFWCLKDLIALPPSPPR